MKQVYTIMMRGGPLRPAFVSFAAFVAFVVLTINPVSGAGRSTFDQLKESFNRDTGMPRLILLTSPTCPACVGGADWVQTEVLNQYPDLKIRVYTIWYEMYPGDSPKAFPAAKKIMPDTRVQHFWDQPKTTGKWFKANVPSDYTGKIMWDAYYLYGSDATWAATPGVPISWGRTILETRKELLRQVAMLDTADREGPRRID
jgi:hypothetical protein